MRKPRRRLYPRARKNGYTPVWNKAATLERPADTAVDNHAPADTAVVRIYNDIGDSDGITSDVFTREIEAVDAPTIQVRLNSRGGDVFEGIAIHHALANHPARVEVLIEGIAASAASVIAMAGDRVVMAQGTQMMIHESYTAAIGNSADMRRAADLLEQTSNDIAAFYANRAGGSVESWRDRMRAETWYTADEAVRAGLADEVATSRKPVRADWDLSVFNYAGRDKSPAPDLGSKPAEPAPVVAPEDSWTGLVGSLLAPSNRDGVFAALVEAL